MKNRKRLALSDALALQVSQYLENSTIHEASGSLDRMCAALREYNDAVWKAPTVETKYLVAQECICPKCGLRHGGAPSDGSF